MADIRIKDLATTASVTASDDFMAVDGTTNGTRKLSAATPSFATSVTTPSLTSPASTPLTLGTGTSGAAITVLSADNKVGIGTTSPSDKFVVSNAGAAGLEIGATSLVITQAYNRSGSAYVDYRDQCLNRIFYTNGTTEALTLSSTQAATFAGAVTVSTGNLVIGTAGNGIDFSATAGTGTSELLNDYEEGTWTPTDNSGAALSFTVYSSTYTKIGRLVEVEAAIYFPATASTAAVQITGLPFTAAGGDDNTGGLSITATNVGGNYYILITRGTSTFTINTNADVSVTNVTYSSKLLKFFGSYHV